MLLSSACLPTSGFFCATLRQHLRGTVHDITKLASHMVGFVPSLEAPKYAKVLCTRFRLPASLALD